MPPGLATSTASNETADSPGRTRPLRVVYLAAGAGGMYCGSCLRDNRLAASLVEMGHDVTLIPLYTPLRTDEPTAAERRVFYGGIRVYLEELSAWFRAPSASRGGLLDSPFVLRLISRWAGSAKPESLGPLTVSILEGDHGRQRRELESLIEGLRPLRPDVINLPNLMFLGIAPRLARDLGARIVCTLSGEDVFLDRLPEPHRQRAFELIERHAAGVDAFIAVTRYFAEHAARHFRLPTERLRYVPLGLRVDEFAAAAPAGEPFTIGYLARICPEKGLDRLAEAFIRLRHAGHRCRLVAAGFLGGRDKAYLKRVRKRLTEARVIDAFEYAGEPDLAGKVRFLQSCHVVSVPAPFHEAKGLYVLEALACGVPVVQPDSGSFPELIRETRGGLLYEADNVDAHVAAIQRLMADAALRESLGREGQSAVRDRFNHREMADQTWRIYESVAAPDPATAAAETPSLRA